MPLIIKLREAQYYHSILQDAVDVTSWNSHHSESRWWGMEMPRCYQCFVLLRPTTHSPMHSFLWDLSSHCRPSSQVNSTTVRLPPWLHNSWSGNHRWSYTEGSSGLDSLFINELGYYWFKRSRYDIFKYDFRGYRCTVLWYLLEC